MIYYCNGTVKDDHSLRPSGLPGKRRGQCIRLVSPPDTYAKLLKSRIGQLKVEDLKAILADHDGASTSICRHPHDGSDHPSVSQRGRVCVQRRVYAWQLNGRMPAKPRCA